MASYVEEIALLESMFGSTVSEAVIVSVIESCNGNVHFAADAIMNFSDEMTSTETSETSQVAENIDVPPVHVTPMLNINAPPFEYRPTQNHESSILPTTERQNSPTTTSLQLPTFENQHQPINLNQQTSTPQMHLSPTTRNRSPNSTRHHPSTSARQPPTSSPPTSGPFSTSEVLSASFSDAFRNTGAIPKKPPDTKPQKPRYTMNIWNDQVGKILHYHNQGARTLIIMRGVSGSGKTFLAKHIVDYTTGVSPQNYSQHIFSSDNFFMRRGVYQFNRNFLEEAHTMNKRKVCEATNKGVSPVIVDNTNTELWEMEPYIRDGVRNGYMIEFVEPNTPWARNANQLEKRNTHGVPREGIKRMLDRYEKGITPASAMKTLRLTYPPNKKPPILRNIPPFSLPGSPRDSESPKRANIQIEHDKDRASKASRVEITRQECPDSPDERHAVVMDNIADTENSHHNVDRIPDEHENKLKKIIEAQQEIEQLEKVEQEWENGESWDAINKNNASSQMSLEGFGVTSDPKPPRKTENIDTEKLAKPSKTCLDETEDWSTFLQPWPSSNITNSGTTVEAPVQVESISIGTSFEVDDMNGLMHTVMFGTPRDINEGIPEKNRPRIPKTIIFDKSTSTHDNDFLSKKETCKNKEHHFRELRRMFKFVPRLALRDMFESCYCDVNWAVDLVLESYPESLENVNNDVVDSDEEEEGPIEECNCLAGYNIIPDVTPKIEISPAQEPENVPLNTTPVAQKKPKREYKSSENSLQLKRQIESNVTISENYYSQHYLNWRRRRENYIDGLSRPVSASVSNNDNNQDIAASVSNNADNQDVSRANVSGLGMSDIATALPEVTQNTDATDFRDVAGPSTAHYNLQFLDADFVDSDTESDSNKSDNLDRTVTINLGPEFLAKLDELFGRKDFLYPENIQPVINLPMSILKQINAHWAMSVAAQMDDGSKQSEAMIKQDEDFARQLSAREQEMSDEGKEPEIPTLKEIMDMELAYTIYEKGVSEWKNNEPQDLAAKLSRQKLYNLFPDMSKEVLAEILMAHDYSFKETVESLLVSTGQSSWLEEEKGVERFVMNKEMERKEKFVEEETRNLDAAEWPNLDKPEKPITMETVHFYRAEAEKALVVRNTYFEKARQYFANNSPSAASFYSDIAALHTKKYDHYKCLAASYLISYHLKKNPDQDVLDLHYLRVPEALVSVDIFLDRIIQDMRSNNIYTKEAWIITGKGLHSVRGPRIKPATRRHMVERQISYKVNGGLIKVTLYSTNKLTCELSGS